MHRFGGLWRYLINLNVSFKIECNRLCQMATNIPNNNFVLLSSEHDGKEMHLKLECYVLSV